MLWFRVDGRHLNYLVAIPEIGRLNLLLPWRTQGNKSGTGHNMR
jgi:hypothetical protein